MAIAPFYLIDPKAKTVIPAECEVDGFDALYRILDCTVIESVALNYGDYLLLDEEGLLHKYRQQGFFVWREQSQPYVGRAAVFGSAGGELVKPRLTLAAVQAAVRFITDDVARTRLMRPPFGL